MVGPNLFKTRICLLYRKGNCHRHNCAFAHGDAELRRYNTSSSSFNGRQDYEGVDLRNKIGRNRSPFRRNSLDRDARDRFPSHGHDSPRFGKKSDWGQRKRHHFDGEREYSGSLKSSDGADQTRDTKPSSSDFHNFHDDQLKHVQSEIDMLEDHKEQLQMDLEERVQEADSLNSKIEELEMQLSNEKDECRRISSKIKKFVKANHRHSRIQEELKRSEARVQRLGEQLGLDAKAAAIEEDISINILSDEENLGNDLISPKYDNKDDMSVGPLKDQYKDSPSKKRTRVHMLEDSGRNMGHERWDPQMKNNDEVRNFVKPTRKKTSFPFGDRFRESKSSRMVTTMVDDVDDEVEEHVSLPPPPPLPAGHNAYLQYKGRDVDDDVDDDVDEMLDVDIV